MTRSYRRGVHQGTSSTGQVRWLPRRGAYASGTGGSRIQGVRFGVSLSCLTVPDAEDRAVVIRHPNVEPRPLPAPQGQAYVARGGIEMECGVVGVQERSEALGDCLCTSMSAS